VAQFTPVRCLARWEIALADIVEVDTHSENERPRRSA
jgi:hypothetical protein